MKVIAVLLLALATASAGSLPNLTFVHPRDRTTGPSIEGRIIGGNPADPEQIPFQVGLIFLSIINSWFCGGSIISPKWILTAAHCTDGAIIAYIYVGSTDLISGKNYTVNNDDFRQHKEFNSDSLDNDISLIELPEPLEFDKFINKIGLPLITSSGTYTWKTATISGWGLTSNTGEQPKQLQYANVKVIPNILCNMVYPGLISDKDVCTSVADGKSTCFGDSGGPLTIYDKDIGHFQIGVISFVSSKGCDFGANGAASTFYFRDWIHENSGV